VNKASVKRLRISNFKLNALLDITQAINENLSKEELLQRYENILRKDLNIGKIVIFNKGDDHWDSILVSGVSEDTYKTIDVEKDLIHHNEITFVTASRSEILESFDIIIPVYNNNAPLAFVLIGDIEEEGEGVSPIIKHLNFIQTLSNIIIVAIENIRLFTESLRQEALKKELELASKMQTLLIPDSNSLPSNDIVKISSYYHPHFDVGGDYYDVLELNKNEVGFCIADVSGKGISAALLMSNFQANLRALFNHEISLPALLERLNTKVMGAAKGEKFITLFIAKYHYKTKELEFVNAGHNPPLMYLKEQKKLMKLSSGCVGMGMLDEIPLIKKGFMIINEPTKILCYTDGIVELANKGEISHETTELEKNIVNSASVEENINDIVRDVNITGGSTAIFDDITLLGVELF
jgi:sigma-B regulation protein RsbU (phosphoserine phosphatase)